MKVLNIIKLVCDFVGERELFGKLSSSTLSLEELSEKEQQKIDRMLRCFNLVNQEIASEYAPLLQKEEVCGSIINFSTLSKKVISVFEVKNRFGFSLSFRQFQNHIEVKGNAKTVLYSYFPDELLLKDEFEGSAAISERVYAYGTASEYLLLEGVGEDAQIWENRYKESLFVLTRKKGEHILPRRRWL